MWRTFAMSRNIIHDEIELFHGLSNELPQGLSKIASVVTIHDVAFKTFPNMYHWNDRLVYNQKWAYACKHADQIIAISQCTKRDIMHYYGVEESKISVVYQPANKIYYEASVHDEIETPSSNPPYLLYIGSINSRKNLLSIVKAMELLPKDLQIPLVIVGNGHEYKRQVEQYIAQHNIGHLFVWKEVNDSRELKKLYTGAVAFVYPSFYEGFGLPVIEAQLCGCPVITSNVSSLPEAGGPFALTVNPSSIEEISNSITRVLTDSELREQLKTGGQQYVFNTFHPTTLAHQLMEVYHEAIQKHGSK